MVVFLKEQFLWDRSFFAFREENINSIHESIFFLSHWGLPPDYLTSVPAHIFKLYIKLYNKKGHDDEFHRFSENSSKQDNEPHPVGISAPKNN